jgi:phosphate starvation-inducible PhoH-like protein
MSEMSEPVLPAGLSSVEAALSQPASTPAASSQAGTEAIDLGGSERALNLAGSQECNLRLLRRLSGAQLTLRGQQLLVKGSSLQRQRIRLWAEMVGGADPVSQVEAELTYQAVVADEVEDYRQAQAQILARTRQGHSIRPKTPGQQAYINAIANHELVFGIGPAGTGKTYLATVMAVVALQERRCERLILTRPAVEAGEKLGFLPGDLKDKVDPYLRPLYDALHDLLTPDQVIRLIEQNTIEIAPLAYMRGRTLSRAFVILDEAQNTTPEQMKMALTRLGEGSRMVVTGDLSQTDLGSRQTSGLGVAARVLKGLEGIAFHYLREGDVVRHPLVRRIVAAYNLYEQGEPVPPSSPSRRDP